MKVIAFFYPYFSSITETFSTTISQLVLIRQSYSLRCPTLFHKKLATQLPHRLHHGRSQGQNHADYPQGGRLRTWILHGHQWLTPAHPLLAGTKRAFLLDQGAITEKDLTPDDLMKAEKIRLFNAMIDFGEIEIINTQLGSR